VFKKHSDHLISLGVGQRALITQWLDYREIKNYIIHKDLSIDIKGGACLVYEYLFDYPEYIKINKVKALVSEITLQLIIFKNLINIHGDTSLLINNLEKYHNKDYCWYLNINREFIIKNPIQI
jgi:hypothetical protein